LISFEPFDAFPLVLIQQFGEKLPKMNAVLVIWSQLQSLLLSEFGSYKVKLFIERFTHSLLNRQYRLSRLKVNL